MNIAQLCMQSAAGGHLGCFHFEAIMNTAALNILCLSFGGHVHSFLLGIYPAAELGVKG